MGCMRISFFHPSFQHPCCEGRLWLSRFEQYRFWPSGAGNLLQEGLYVRLHVSLHFGPVLIERELDFVILEFCFSYQVCLAHVSLSVWRTVACIWRLCQETGEELSLARQLNLYSAEDLLWENDKLQQTWWSCFAQQHKRWQRSWIDGTVGCNFHQGHHPDHNSILLWIMEPYS